jgi:hypothetical protein
VQNKLSRNLSERAGVYSHWIATELTW